VGTSIPLPNPLSAVAPSDRLVRTGSWSSSFSHASRPCQLPVLPMPRPRGLRVRPVLPLGVPGARSPDRAVVLLLPVRAAGGGPGVTNLRRAWINQPSTQQEHHDLHGRRVLAAEDRDGVSRVFFTEGPVVSMELRSTSLSDGWYVAPVQRQLDAVMHSVDKWFDEGDSRLKDDPSNRSAAAREIALQAIEKAEAKCLSMAAAMAEVREMLRINAAGRAEVTAGKAITIRSKLAEAIRLVRPLEEHEK
jgi:hypothetical protein